VGREVLRGSAGSLHTNEIAQQPVQTVQGTGALFAEILSPLREHPKDGCPPFLLAHLGEPLASQGGHGDAELAST
jgi:hypothetical protein